MNERPAFVFALACLLATSSASFAQTLDPNASVVHLRKSCTDVPAWQWCFTSTSALTDWIWRDGPTDRTNPPSSTDRVRVLAGPGDFDKFICDATGTPRGWVTVIGAGRSNTRLVANSGDIHTTLAYCQGGITVDTCEDLNFQDLTAYGSHNGVFWVDGGSATWSDVDFVAGGPSALDGYCGSNGTATLGWYDAQLTGGVSTQYFFGCRAIGNGLPGGSWTIKGFDTGAMKAWFYGGDIIAQPTTGSAHEGIETLMVAAPSQLHVFGTSIRASVGTATSTAFTSFRGASAYLGSSFHMHGGIINADASASTQNVNAIAVWVRGLAHLHGTAFDVKAGGTGTATRLFKQGNGNIQAPFTWHAGTTPPAITSVSGQDFWVDTNADGTGHSRLMIYDSSCDEPEPSGEPQVPPPGGLWRDQTDDTCR